MGDGQEEMLTAVRSVEYVLSWVDANAEQYGLAQLSVECGSARSVHGMAKRIVGGSEDYDVVDLMMIGEIVRHIRLAHSEYEPLVGKALAVPSGVAVSDQLRAAKRNMTVGMS